MGAAGLLPPQIAPTGRRTQQGWDELKREAAERRKTFHRREQFPLPAPEGFDQWTAARLGQLAGVAQPLENWIWWSPENFPAALAFNGLMGIGPNLLAQDMHVRAGLRDKVSASEALLAGALNVGLNKATDAGAGLLRNAGR